MATMLCRTKANTNPKGKPRVYYTCHPEDFDKYFDKICEDIFKTHDCTIFYTEDMNAVIAEQDKATDLESNNLFVVPVTFRLLSTQNRAMDADIPFALEKRIPVLPFMTERGIDSFYEQRFGELQYLNPYSDDTTEIPYEEKLKKYLESVLIGDELARRVRAAFDAYIFLSYRKKDRRYANELMHLIHSCPECRDVAIWYDEFLTPGESFRQNIVRVLSDSELFALLVTPNILEAQNFVMQEEYPAAKRSGISILPIEMEKTDKTVLLEKYADIPQCADPHDAAFKNRLVDALQRVAVQKNDEDPLHNYLIGLAYMEGIDVEVDRQQGLQLITSAAENALPEAMERLYRMYWKGLGVQIDYRKAAYWLEKLVDCYQNLYGHDHRLTMYWMNNLAVTYLDLGEYLNAKELLEKVYAFNCSFLGEYHRETLAALSNLASSYGKLGDRKKTLELDEKVYTLRCRILGEEHSNTLISLNNMAVSYDELGKYKKALELKEKAYTLRCRTLGEAHPDTLISLSNLAASYGKLGNREKALELDEKACMLRCRILGEEHPDTLISLSNLAVSYGRLGDYKKALEMDEKAYILRCRILGEEHPDTLMSLQNMIVTYNNLDEHQKASELTRKLYALQCKLLGAGHPDTIDSFYAVAAAYIKSGDHTKKEELYKEMYDLLLMYQGPEYPQTAELMRFLKIVI